MKAILGGKIVTPSAVVGGMAALFEDRIAALVPENEVPADAEIICANGNYVLPGLVDMHIHGYLGADASDGAFEGLKTMAEGVAKNGVTAFLPTTMTVSYSELRAAFEQIRLCRHESEKDTWRGAQVMGANAEGPFINASKKGAQAAEHLHHLLAHQLQRVAQHQHVGVIGDVAAGRAQMDDARSLGALKPVCVHVGHDVVPALLFAAARVLVVDVRSVALQLLDLLLGDVEAKLTLALGERNPEPAPQPEAVVVREDVRHLPAGIACVQGILIDRCIRHVASSLIRPGAARPWAFLPLF